MPDNVNITVNETIENVVINPSISTDVIDVNTYSTTENVNIAVTPELTTININSVTSSPQVNSDWNATSGVAQILNKPTIPSIAGLATTTYVDNQDALKVDKVAGKGLSENDYTTTEKNKLSGIAAGAEVNVNADWNATSGDAEILNKPTIPAAVIVDATPTDGSANAVSSNGVFDALTTKQSQLDGTGFVKASGTTISYDNSNYKKNVISAVGNFNNPQNLTQNIVRSYVIPANTFLPNDIMNLSISFDKYNSNGTATVRAYINSSVTLTGAQLIMTFTSATTSRFIVLKRTFGVFSNNLITGLLSTRSEITDSAASTTTSEAMTYASNQERFLIITIQQTNVNDTVYTPAINLTN